MSVYALGSASVVVSSTTQAQLQTARALHCENLSNGYHISEI